MAERRQSGAREPGWRSRPRRLLTLVLAVVLLVAAGALLGWLAARPHGSAAPGWTTLKQDDPRVAAAFEALRRDGLPAALDTLERLASRDSLVLRDGHQFAHSLGRRALASSGGNPEILAQCRPVFASGCYHGVVEEYLGARGDIDMAELERMCSAGAVQEPGRLYECMHGLGHGVLGAVGLDSRAALHACDALSTSRFRSSCHEGVFMEAINSALAPAGARDLHEHAGMSHAHHEGEVGSAGSGRLVLDPRDPYAPCDQFAGPYAESCWLFQGFVILRAAGFNVAQGFRTCDGAPDGKAGRCYESLGLQLTGLFQRGDEWILQQCAKGQPERAPQCAAGAALTLAGLDWSGARAMRFCSAAPADWKAACYDSAVGLLDELATPSQRTAVCAAVDQGYVGSCRRAAGLDVRN
jgi:hypothetical protein